MRYLISLVLLCISCGPKQKITILPVDKIETCRLYCASRPYVIDCQYKHTEEVADCIIIQEIK